MGFLYPHVVRDSMAKLTFPVNIEGNQTCGYSLLFTTNFIPTVCLLSAKICMVEVLSQQ